MLYRAIIRHKKPPKRPLTVDVLREVKQSLEDFDGLRPTDARIWPTLKQSSINKSTRGFLWGSLHGSQRIGLFWNRTDTPNGGYCADCGNEMELMTHILLECRSSGQSIIWVLAEHVWHKTGRPWPTLSLGTVLGCGLFVFNDSKGKPDPAAK